MKSGEASGLVCSCRGDSRVKDVLVSHRGDREDTSTRSLRDLLLRRHGSTATTSPWQPARDDERRRADITPQRLICIYSNIFVI